MDSGVTLYIERAEWQRSRKHELSAEDVNSLIDRIMRVRTGPGGHPPAALRKLADDLDDNVHESD